MSTVTYPYSDHPDNQVHQIEAAYRSRIQGYSILFLKKMEQASRKFHACDATAFEKDVSHTELDGLVHNYEQYQMEDPLNSGVASRDLKAHPASCVGQWSCDDDRVLVDIDVCKIIYTKQRKFTVTETYIDGFMSRAPGGISASSFCEHGTIEQKSGTKQLCKCFNNQPQSASVHIINLQAIEADVDRNMILTGARIVVKHGVLQLEIKQGKLSREWQVNGGEWKEMDDISEKVRLTRQEGIACKGQSIIREHVDYAVFSPHLDKISLNGITVDHGYVLTGLKFIQNDGVLKLAILARKFSHVHGIVLTSCSSKLYSPVEPVGETQPTVQISVWNTGKRNVVGPFFDAMPLASLPPSPLGGAGLIYKTPNNGKLPGLVALELISINYARYLTEELEAAQEFIMDEKKVTPD